MYFYLYYSVRLQYCRAQWSWMLTLHFTLCRSEHFFSSVPNLSHNTLYEECVLVLELICIMNGACCSQLLLGGKNKPERRGRQEDNGGKRGDGGLVRRKDERKSKWWKMSSEFICNWSGLHYKLLADSCQYSAYFSVLTSSIKLEKIISLETER